MSDRWDLGGVADVRALDVLAKIDEIRIARLRPGDVVLVKTPADMLEDDLAQMLATVQHWFPHNDVRVLAGIDIEVVRPEGSEVAVPVDGTFERP